MHYDLGLPLCRDFSVQFQLRLQRLQCSWTSSLCRRTSDSRTCHTAVLDSCWRRCYLVSETKAKCELQNAFYLLTYLLTYLYAYTTTYVPPIRLRHCWHCVLYRNDL